MLAFAAVACSLYLNVFEEQLAYRPGLPTTLDIVVGVIGVVTLLEAARRALGPAIVVVSLLAWATSFSAHTSPR